MKFVQGVLKLTRLYNLIIIALCQLLLAANIENLSYVALISDWKFVAIIISTLAIAAGGNVINDYYDVKIDYINKPDEVVVGKTVSRRTTMLLHALLSYGGIFVAFFVSWKLAVADTFIVILLWYYSNRLKCVPLLGNLAVGILTAMVVIVLPMYFGEIKTEYLVFSYFAFVITLIRELTKDLEDVRGDIKFDCETYPKKYGIRNSLRLLVAFEVVFLLSLILAVIYKQSNTIMIYSAIGLLLPGIFLIYKSIYSRKKEDFSLLSFIDKIIIIFGLFSATLL